MTGLRVERLRCEHLADPGGLDVARPRLSWQVRSSRRGAVQLAYRILAASRPELLQEGNPDLWDTGKVLSPQCVLVPFGGEPLASREQVFWSVRVWDDEDVVSPYADIARFEIGLLQPSDWQAQWIAAPEGAESSSVTYLRSTLGISAPVRRARAYVTALGLYEFRFNGQRIGDARLTPGWTDYTKRIQYQVFDLTHLVAQGANLIEARLADGWYAGYIGFQGRRRHYGEVPQLLAQVEVDTDTGRIVHTTGDRWTAARGPIRSSDMLRGETYDGCAEVEPARPARVTTGTSAVRVTSPAPPVRVLEERHAVSVHRADGVHRIDFGQNLVGWVRLELIADAGTTIRVRHAEILQPDGRLYVENLRTADASDSYVLGAAGRHTLEPSFTIHGFRYAEVSGYDGDLSASDVVAAVCGSDLERVGEFSCADPALNQLHSNILWSARGNFVDIPTDCPQRDERMGWTGDAQVFAPTACYLFDAAGFFTKWLRDIRDAQTPDGSFPDVAPLVVLEPGGSAGWADAGVIVPSVLWNAYGDENMLAENYPAMRRWVECVRLANPDLLWIHARGYDNGDWLAVHAETDKDLIATAYFANSARLTARAAGILHLSQDEVELDALADAVAAAFRTAYVLPDGRLKCETQTAYALALRFGLIPPELASAAARHLVEDIERHDTHLTTGFLGVGQLLPALSDAGFIDVAYRLLQQKGYPSWLYAVMAGATTIWERWDGWTADAGYGDPAMNSYNHYALGSVGEWLYRTVAGISYVEPGGRRIQISPTIDQSLGWVKASHRSSYGVVHTAWQLGEGGSLTLDVKVPVNAAAVVRIPAGQDDYVGESGRSVAESPGVRVLKRDREQCLVEVGSGHYSFTVAPVADTEGNVRTRRKEDRVDQI